MRQLARVLAVGTTLLGAVVVAQSPAHADPSSCTVTPAPGTHGPMPSVTCPAGAGDFTFRVAGVCADGYPGGGSGPYLWNAYGPWVRASATTATTSSVTCYGYVPGSGFGWSASIQVQ